MNHGVCYWLGWCGVGWGMFLRMPATSTGRCAMPDLQSTAVCLDRLGRMRTGPHNSGHRNGLRYLQRNDIALTTASDRDAWKSQEKAWLLHHGMMVPGGGRNVFGQSEDKCLWEKRCLMCLQGSFHGQQMFHTVSLRVDPGRSCHS